MEAFETAILVTAAAGIGGTGLGLSIVKHIARYYHGKIDLFSRENIGTTITITLPDVIVDESSADQAA